MPVLTLVCPDDCESLTLPEVNSDPCNSTNESSEIVEIYVGLADAATFTDVEDPEEWADRLSDDDTPPVGSMTPVGDLIRAIIVTADIPASTPVTKDLSGGRYGIAVGNDYVMNIDMDEATDENYNFARNTECGNLKVRFWYKDLGGILYGGNSGIIGDNASGAVLRLDPVWGRGQNELLKLTGSIKWRAKTAPDRCVSPI